MSTVLGLLGFAGTVVLTWLLCWVYRECAREMRAATETMQNQKSTIGAMHATIKAMSESQNITRCQIESLESSAAEREQTIDGMIAKIEEMQIEKNESAVRIACQRDSLKKQRCELIEAKRLARQMFTAISQSSLVEAPAELATEQNQPQNPLCDN